MTRHELREQVEHDRFTDSVSSAVNYAATHRDQVIRWAIVLVAVCLIAGGAFWYSSYRSSIRRQDLQKAFDVVDARVGPADQPNQFGKSFPTEAAKRDASIKALSVVVNKDGGSREGLIAQYYRGTLKASAQDLKGAEADLKVVANSNSECAPLAKIALAQLYAGEHRMPEARALLQGIVDKPTDLVSKQQAQILLAQLEKTTNPQAAAKILQSLKAPNERPAVVRAAQEVAGPPQ